MRTGITETSYSKYYGFEEGIKRIGAHGYETMDYQGFVDTTKPLFEKNSYEFERYLKEQRSLTEQAGLVIHQAHAPWCWPPLNTTKEERAERFEKMSRSIVGTGILGCKNFVLHPLLPFLGEDEEHAVETREINLDFLGRLCTVTRENGVTLCLENLPFPQFPLSSVSAVLELVKDIGEDSMKVCLDTGHCTMFETKPGDAVRMLGKEYLQALHVHDNDGRGDYHWNPFAGVIDWEDFGRALYEIGYEGVLSLETEVMSKIPAKLREYEEAGLYKKARYIADLATGEKDGI